MHKVVPSFFVHALQVFFSVVYAGRRTSFGRAHIYTNASLFGNSNRRTSNSAYYFIHDFNLNTSAIPREKSIFDNCFLDQEYNEFQKEIDDLKEKYMAIQGTGGWLLQYELTSSAVQNFVKIERGGIIDPLQERNKNPLDVLNAYHKKGALHDSTTFIIYTSLLTPGCGIKTHTYHMRDKEQFAAWEHECDELIQKIETAYKKRTASGDSQK